MSDLEKIWNFCEQRKNACDKNIEALGLENMFNPMFQNQTGMSTAYWSVQKCIEDIWEGMKGEEHE